jgi:cytochrome P450
MNSRNPPGPNDHLFGMRTLSRMKADVLGSYAALHREYGDSVYFRTGPYRFYVFFHPDQIREVLVKHAKSIIRMPRVMETFAQWNGKSLLIAEGAQWARKRRLVQPAFHPRRMESYGQTMVDSAQRLIESWQDAFDRQGYLDVETDRAMTNLTFSIICRTMFDSDLADRSEEVAKAVSVLGEVAFFEMQAPVRLPAWTPTAWYRRKRWAIGVLDEVVWQFVRRRREEGTDHGDLLSMLLAAVDEESGGMQLNDEQVRDEAMTLMLAGHDTTAAGFDWLWYNIARFPDVAVRCRDEVDTVLGSRAPTTKDIERLPYLVGTIKETMRLHPPAIGIFLRQTAADVVIGGYHIPRKSLITLSTYVTQRDERWFPDPARFDPERFLPDRLEQIPQGAYFPFGAGPRVCIGQSFAMTEMTLVAATLLQACEVTTIPGATDPIEHVTMALRPKDPLVLRWKLRES